MNDQLLRERLDDAVAGIRATHRLDEILAGPPGGTVPSPSPSRQPPRRITLIAAAAALIALAAFAAGWAVRSAERPTTRLEIPPVTTTAVGSATAPDRTRVGQQVSVASSALPAGVGLVDETVDTSADTFSATIRLARGAGTWNGDGPYVRITASQAPGFGTQWTAATTGQRVGDVGGHPAFLTQAAPGLGPGWVSLGWATGPDEAIEVQAKGLDQDALLQLARSVQVDP